MGFDKLFVNSRAIKRDINVMTRAIWNGCIESEKKKIAEDSNTIINKYRLNVLKNIGFLNCLINV